MAPRSPCNPAMMGKASWFATTDTLSTGNVASSFAIE